MPLAEKKIKIAKILSIIVALSGIAVIFGWILDIRFLKSLSPAWVSMKFVTAISFLLSGVSLFFIARSQEGEFDQAQVALSLTSLILFLLMGVLFFSTVLGAHTGAESLFIEEPPGGVKTVVPGLPSIPTMGNFLLIASAGVLTILGFRKLPLMLKSVGCIIGITGALAILGYMINLPFLYYYLEGVNSAMAAHTAILFVLLGLGFICL